MFKRTAAVLAFLALGGLDAARAQRVKAEVDINYAPTDSSSAGVAPQKITQLVADLQGRVSKLVALKSFDDSTGKNSVYVQMVGEWRDPATSKDAADKLRDAIRGVDGEKLGIRLSFARARVEIRDQKTEDKEEVEKVTHSKSESHEHGAPRLRWTPRMVIQLSTDGKGFAEFTAEEVPLLRVMDDLAKSLQLSFALEGRYISVPVFVSLRNVTLEEVLEAIGESLHGKLERRGKYLVFVEARGR